MRNYLLYFAYRIINLYCVLDRTPRYFSIRFTWRAGEITATAAMKELGLKPNTFYRRVKEMGL